MYATSPYTVSYTHLDVYKRQIVFNEEGMKHGVTGLAAIAVEYLNR